PGAVAAGAVVPGPVVPGVAVPEVFGCAAGSFAVGATELGCAPPGPAAVVAGARGASWASGRDRWAGRESRAVQGVPGLDSA
ncbi:hypothetical protein, partial [Nocardia vaccinii]|uniref:hypothetical protein n=1 Tax=Nocardia vaccinii TaxID=1822 RepID=UPI001C3FE3DA